MTDDNQTRPQTGQHKDPQKPPASPPASSPASSPKRLSSGMRMAVDLGPLGVFFATNYLYGIMVGTAALMAAVAVAIMVTWLLERSVPLMPAITCVFVMIFGGLTLAFDDELFIKLKPTLVNLLFAGGLAVGLAVRRNFMRRLFGGMLRLTEEGWRIMTRRWIAMFVFLAVLNELVWRSVDTDSWVTFKAFGIPVIVVIFSLTLAPILNRHQLPDAGNDGDDQPETSP